MSDTAVVFGSCAKCAGDILRTDKRKILDGKFYHLTCYIGLTVAPSSNGNGNGHTPSLNGDGNDVKLIADILSRIVPMHQLFQPAILGIFRKIFLLSP